MTYQECIDFLYSATPQFEAIGAAAYKPGLDTVRTLDRVFGSPSQQLKVIHIAGTNGKGSTAHTLAAVLQQAGYRTALFTSPHLIDFRERIRIDGKMISQEEVVAFVEKYLAMEESRSLSPSFFELTTVMAFDWFASSAVDVAVIEVGLGGRLDSTNIVNPLLSVITNISFDHMAQLGNTLESIAREKCGIMRPGVPVVTGETNPEVLTTLRKEAATRGTPLIEAANLNPRGIHVKHLPTGGYAVSDPLFGSIHYEMDGDYQKRNIITALHCLPPLQEVGFAITPQAVAEAFPQICSLTRLMGRWHRLSDSPLTICDTGHNEGGWEYLSAQIAALPRPLVMVMGFVRDKDLSHILPHLPKDAQYIFTNAPQPRALPALDLLMQAEAAGIKGYAVAPVSSALEAARALKPASIFIGGSTFVVAEALKATV